MTERQIRTGLAWYVAARDGVRRFGRYGTVVDVADSDLERFDRFNPAPPEAPEPEGEGQEDDEGAGPAETAEGPAEPALPAVEKPAGNASLEAWQEYALAQGAAPADLEGKSRDEVRAQFQG